MGGYSFSYNVYKNYIVDIFEFYEDTSFTRAFIYKKNYVGRDLVEIKDFPMGTEVDSILKESEKFIIALEQLITPLKIKKVKQKSTAKVIEEEVNKV
ncbi:hypothetical protein [uncultured Ilyobacter sp.]|uniref:hypothetical protein n=1 Tax=uncultured Ilyobacter sp. TaxID=544433 RepID=UPI0029C850D4|nr:hypothetical protein [uncultured Ilyobacter sp.]